MGDGLMKKSICLLIMLCIILTKTTSLAYDGSEPLNIIIIHAYHYGYDWTLNNNVGARDVILEAYPDANIYTEFLDWKRFPDERIISQKLDEFLIKYKDVPVDLVLTTDDMGLDFVLEHRRDLFGDVPVAFSGIIEHTANEIIGNEKDVTGVYENMAPEGAYELVRLLQPKVKKLVFIHDLSESGIRTAEAFDMAAQDMGINEAYIFEDWHEKTYEEILNDVGLLKDDTAVMLFSYNRSRDGVVKSVQTFAREISNASSVPLYSNSESMLGAGITGGTFLSGLLQGEKLGQLGLEIIAGADPDDIAHISEATVYSGVDALQLNRFNLDENQLPAEVLIINQRFSFLKTYWRLVLGVSIVLVGLLIFILVLLYQQMALRLSRKKVIDQKHQLQDIYEQLQGSEEELRAQNEELETYQDHLEHQALTDYLTELPNRVSLDSYAKKMLTEAGGAGHKAAVLFIDVNKFKFVNNTFGHKFGDAVLVILSERLRDLQEDVFVARIGGDEFVMIQSFEPNNERELVDGLLNKINKDVGRPIVVDGEQVTVKVSIGYSIYPDDGNDYDQLIVEADTAMLLAKKDGNAMTKRYKSGMSHVYQNEYIMIKSLKEAYTNEEFYLLYQPIMTADGSRVASFEALARWESSEYGQVAPDVFIPLAETSGLMIPIGYYIIDQALEFAKIIRRSPKDQGIISINISVVQFYEDDFVEVFLRKITDAGLLANNIQIEITESIMIETYNWLIKKLIYLREQGILIALDDFGTGYSSLAYLHELPLDKLKIDKVFVDDIEDEYTKIPLVDATLTLASSFDMEVVAEGVERQEQLNYLRRKGCSLIQGYYFSRPLCHEDAIAYWKEWFS